MVSNDFVLMVKPDPGLARKKRISVELRSSVSSRIRLYLISGVSRAQPLRLTTCFVIFKLVKKRSTREHSDPPKL